MRTIKIAMTLFCITCVFGCDRHSHDYDASKSEIVGVWNVTDNSVERLKVAGHTEYINNQDHRIEFFEDGTCKISTYMRPLWRPGSTEQKESYISAEDRTWEITIKDGSPAVNTTHKTVIINERGKTTNSKSSYLYISRIDGRIVLWYYIGDPDSKKYIEFVKE